MPRSKSTAFERGVFSSAQARDCCVDGGPQKWRFGARRFLRRSGSHLFFRRRSQDAAEVSQQLHLLPDPAGRPSSLRCALASASPAVHLKADAGTPRSAKALVEAAALDAQQQGQLWGGDRRASRWWIHRSGSGWCGQGALHRDPGPWGLGLRFQGC